MKRRTLIATVAAAALALGACSGGTGEEGGDSEFPTKDITLIVQAAAGGGSDLSSRALATALEPILGVSIVVENRPGASGSTAMLHVKDQPADGYTIGFGPVEIAMLGSMNYDVHPSDYDMLGQIMLGPGVLSVPADSPYNTLEEFVAAAQDKEMTVANSGAGSIWELAGASLADETGAQIKPVPFDGGAPAVAAVLGGQVDAAASGVNEVKQNLADGKLKVLAIFHSERHPEIPDVPTAAEQGYDIEIGGWGGIYAPKGLPEDVHETLESAIAEAVEQDSYQEIITGSGNLVVYRDSAEFTEFAESEAERFAGLLEG
ncbi:tripartite tricarboxylate transporter substrate binding protein [Tessaracoccus rhinocerotis]|uniref:Tripartite tricarboxylate transporter substrate binding protein n=1 Tax=Tessaracoccus rhinocerotis TaxID=1689449 RepID=A0A553K082_9ACTN|nr:tripartite tricarboxylate transporter substrate binding protein [Tessaracoccus rhinocerotis]TRY18110.1 tripartite tricarboxylate transporter substrate binding protein [Tessaracoccus rhinocerotis]